MPIKITHSNPSYESVDMLGNKRTYNYNIFSKETKKGKEVKTERFVVFNTDESDDDDSLRFIEDIAEEIANLHRLSKENTKWYEKRGDRFWAIEMRWEPNRFRGTSWIELDKEDEKKLETTIT